MAAGQITYQRERKRCLYSMPSVNLWEKSRKWRITAVKLKSEEKMGFTNSACRLNRKTPEKKQPTIVELQPQNFRLKYGDLLPEGCDNVNNISISKTNISKPRNKTNISTREGHAVLLLVTCTLSTLLPMTMEEIYFHALETPRK